MALTPHSLPRPARHRAGLRAIQLPFKLTWTTLALGAIVLLAAALRFANIGAIGQSNTYYTAAIESMLQSWHNFFFVAAEPGGSVSIDKPPVGLWLEAISAFFLGVNGFAVVLPNILAGIASVLVLFHLVRRWFGNVGGLMAALALAITPVAIAVERNNTPDGMLILTLLLAAWGFIKATETHKLRYLLVGAAMIGVGFNIKMMQALLPLPAMYAMYFFCTKQPWWKKATHLVATTLVLIPIALSWATIVDLTPADQRPYVGSSSNNSAYNLIFGYNGVERLTGQNGGVGAGGAMPERSASTERPTPPENGTAPQGGVGGDGRGGPGGQGNAGGMFGTGTAGPLRLFQSGLASQVSWLLLFGLLSILAMAASVARERRLDTARARGLVLWGGWLLTCVAFFSVAGFFHQYYLAMLAAPLAAIVAMGAVFLWQLHRTNPVRAAALLLVTAGATLAFQIYAVAMYGALAWWIAIPIALALAGTAVLGWSLRQHGRFSRWAFTLLIVAMLAVPGVWSGLTTARSNSNLPTAYTGTSGQAMGGRARAAQAATGGASTSDAGTKNAQPSGGAGGGASTDLINYLEANTQNNTYLVVVPSSQTGSELVLETGRPVLYAGGFSGNDPVIDATSLAELAASGDVRYVLWGGQGGSNSNIARYLQTSAWKVVTDSSLGTATSATSTTSITDGRGGMGGGGQLTLYEYVGS